MVEAEVQPSQLLAIVIVIVASASGAWLLHFVKDDERR